MEAIRKKRKLSTTPAGPGPRKRTKSVATTRQQKQAKRRPVSVDSLPWKKVEVPEMLDDAEGFYGLEEVEGVEVVRHGDKIEFVSRDRRKWKRRRAN